MDARNGNSIQSDPNGVNAPQTRTEAGEALENPLPLTLGYRASSYTGLFGTQNQGRFASTMLLGSIEYMLEHPDVKLPYGCYKSGISNVRFKVKAGSQAQADFAHDLYTKLWSHSLKTLQLHLDYGWCGYEPMYREKAGKLHLDSIRQLHPLDTHCLTKRGIYQGLSVSGGMGSIAGVSLGNGLGMRLWGPGKWPAKALWLSHDARWNRWYGRSQMLGAWRPYQRLTAPDCAEELIDGGIYRFAYCGPVIRYPSGDFRKKNGTGDIDFDAARNEARQFAEQAKAGVSIALPSDLDAHGNYKWLIEWVEKVLDVGPLLEYEGRLQKQISRGVGVPPELFEASETGSGWSGRKIPLLGFYVQQVQEARDIVSQVKIQLADPLLRWNYGPSAWCEVEVEIDMPAALSGDPKEKPSPGATGVAGGAPAPGPEGAKPPEGPKAGAQLSTESEPKRFYRPENYEKIKDLKGGKELWAGANDWESGWTWAGIHAAGLAHQQRSKSNEPEKWTEIDHADCPHCKGELNAYGKTGRGCYSWSKDRVEEWLKSKSRELSTTFDESEHPRGQPENAGEFGSKGGAAGGATAAKVHPEAHKQISALQASLDRSAHLTPEQKAHYSRSAAGVLGRMTPGMLARFGANVHGEAHFAASAGELKQHLIGVAANMNNPAAVEKMKRAGNVGGAFVRRGGKGNFVLDGDRAVSDESPYSHHGETEGVYAHEFVHAVDGAVKGRRLSDSAAWQEAFKAELAGGKLTRYAGTDPSEGFAEFGRVLLSGKFDAAAIRQEFPKCHAFWLASDLLTASAAPAPPPEAQRPAVEPLAKAKAALPAPAPVRPPAAPVKPVELFGNKIDMGEAGHADELLPPTRPVSAARAGKQPTFKKARTARVSGKRHKENRERRKRIVERARELREQIKNEPDAEKRAACNWNWSKRDTLSSCPQRSMRVSTPEDSRKTRESLARAADRAPQSRSTKCPKPISGASKRSRHGLIRFPERKSGRSTPIPAAVTKPSTKCSATASPRRRRPAKRRR